MSEKSGAGGRPRALASRAAAVQRLTPEVDAARAARRERAFELEAHPLDPSWTGPHLDALAVADRRITQAGRLLASGRDLTVQSEAERQRSLKELRRARLRIRAEAVALASAALPVAREILDKLAGELASAEWGIGQAHHVLRAPEPRSSAETLDMLALRAFVVAALDVVPRWAEEIFQIAEREGLPRVAAQKLIDNVDQQRSGQGDAFRHLRETMKADIQWALDEGFDLDSAARLLLPG